jgi:hypothetical protein
MAIPPPPQILLSLTRADPTKLDATALKAQLATVGLDCSEITEDALNSYISDVESQIEDGGVQSYAILAPQGSVSAGSVAASVAARRAQYTAAASTGAPVSSSAGALTLLEEVANGDWTEDERAQGWSPNLEVIQFKDHFDWLMSNSGSSGFPGITENPDPVSGNFPNSEAIKKLFVDTATTASATVVKGISQDTMTSVFSNIIQPLTDDNIKDYDKSDSRTVMLVENYNSSTRYCDGVGVVTVDWDLQISDYKRKSKHGGDTHSTYLGISARSVLYTDVVLLCNHYQSVVDHFQLSNPPTCRVV